MNKKTQIFKKLGITILCILEISLVALHSLFDPSIASNSANAASQNIDSQKWMSYVDDNKKICDINIPGTHESGTKYTEGFVTGAVASCQDDSIGEQLRKGIRYFDIRIDSNLDVNHGNVKCYTKVVGLLTLNKHKLTFAKVLNEISGFLKAHPSEAVIIQISQEGKGGKGKDFSTQVNDLLKNYPLLYKHSQDASRLKLKDLRGKFAIFSRSGTIYNSYRYTNWGNNSAFNEIGLDHANCVLQDAYKCIISEDKMAKIKAFYSNIWNENFSTNEKYILNFTSCTGFACPELAAKQINPKFEKFVNGNKDKKLGIVLMDNPKSSLISAIYKTNIK